MAVGVPNIPYKTPVLDDQGYLSDPWSKWFRQLYGRIGGASALTNIELQSLQSVNITALQASVAALQVSVTALQNGSAFDLTQGPTL